MTASYGKYQVLEQVGEGGFGRVYRALDPLLKREVAIKTCTLHQADVRARFVREAEIVASLKHPHIVTVYDFGLENGEPYLVQEFLSGVDLQQLIDRGGGIEQRRRIQWLRQIADGLRYAHGRGIIHRDIKPSNIRIQDDGDVRIMDFGIAKLLEADQQLTQTGHSIGTTGYLAPEQLTGADIDHRVDIFAFGVLAYQLVTGRKPFEGDSFTAVLYRTVHEDPTPLSEAAPDCPPALAALIERCLRKNRDERFASFAPVLDVLDGLLAAPTGAARADAAAIAAAMREEDAEGVASPRQRRSAALWGLGVAGLATAVFGILNLASWTDGAEPREDDVVVVSDTSSDLLADAGDTLSPDDRGQTTSGDGTVAGSTGADAAAGTRATGNDQGNAQRTGGGGAGGGTTTVPPPPPTRTVLDSRRVVLLVQAEDPAVRGAAESAFAGELTGAGYRVVDEAVVQSTGGPAAAAPNALASLARTHGAGWVVVLDVSASAAASVGNMFTGSSSIVVRVYGGEDGSLAGTQSAAVGSGGTPGKLGPTPDAAAVEATKTAAWQAYRAATRIMERGTD